MINNTKNRDALAKEQQVKRLVSCMGTALEALSGLGISLQEAVQMVQARNCTGIPVSIFNSRLGALESIVKYMKEELLLDYRTIAMILHRNEGPIGVTYRRASAKHSGHLDTSSIEMIPFDLFSNQSLEGLSVFELIAYHLAKKGHGWHEIAAILHRHDKTVWTVLDRAKQKMKKTRKR